ncbi:uncharacterized protein [Littorina saxatilis]|uniref:Uncharacterized protein n=3 Tax=Littorina saxatilis TaxID=31220 RepID=A0AAN9C1V3_9CAEN
MLYSIVPEAVILSLGLLFNLVLLIALKHTWSRWTQVKWYVLLVIAGNWLDVLFKMTTQLGVKVTHSWEGGDFMCKLLMLMSVLGPSLANMGVAALSIHVLLTSITGCHGNRLRHALVLGLFVLLSLPWPVTQIPVYGVFTHGRGEDEYSICTDHDFFASHDSAPYLRFYFYVAGAIACVFFPLVVVVGALVGSLMLNCSAYNGSSKSESNTSDLVLTALLGFVLMITCVPVSGFIFHFRGHITFGDETMMLYFGLTYLFYCRAILSALVCVVFAYAHVFRKGRAEQYDTGRKGEGQNLMN